MERFVKRLPEKIPTSIISLATVISTRFQTASIFVGEMEIFSPFPWLY